MSRLGPMGLLVYAIAFGAPMGAALFRVWVNQDAIQVGYALSTQSAKKRELDGGIRQLEVELAAERAPSRLLQLAGRLGLSPAAPDRIFGGRRGP